MYTSSEIKQAVLGILLSDGSLDKRNRFSVSSKYPDFRNHIGNLFNQFPNSSNKVWYNDYLDKRFNVYTYRVVATYPAYFAKFRDWCYPNREKELTALVSNKIDARALAYMWQCDGFLEHVKNRKKDKIQNIGWFCLESFEEKQLRYFCDCMNEKYSLDLKTVIVNNGRRRVPRIKTSGTGLQKLISLMYPYITETFQYKTKLFYKTERYFDGSLPSAEHILVLYNTIQEYEDIVRYSR
jgi:hypothetical protein